MGEWCWEVPAGSLEPGQSFAEAAAAELKEEVGGVASDLIFIGEGYPGNGICDEKVQIFIAADVQIGQTAHEALEFIQIKRFSLVEALALVREGQMSDAMSAYALILSAQQLKALISKKER